jgi:hypothetical protein
MLLGSRLSAREHSEIPSIALRLGAVVDLFDASKLRFVWVFNVADVSIDLGIALILLAALLPLSESRKVEQGNDCSSSSGTSQ